MTRRGFDLGLLVVATSIAQVETDRRLPVDDRSGLLSLVLVTGSMFDGRTRLDPWSRPLSNYSA